MRTLKSFDTRDSRRTQAISEEHGQSMIEFTFMLPLFLALMLGLVIMALIFAGYLSVTLASREGAGSIVRDPSQTCTQVRNSVYSAINWVPSSQLTITIESAEYDSSGNRTSACDGSDNLTLNSNSPFDVVATFTVPVPRISIPDFRGNRIVIFAPFTVSSTSNMTTD